MRGPVKKGDRTLALSNYVTSTRYVGLRSNQELGKLEPGQLVPPGVWTIEEVKEYGRDKGICPYFAVRRMMPFCDIIIYSFHYLLDPKVAEQVSKEMSKDAIVVFDEAHNIGTYKSLRQTMYA